MKQLNTSQVILYLSIFAAAFFAFLAIISYYPIKLSYFSIFVELLTGPLVVFLFLGFGFSIYKIFKNERSKRVFAILILNAVTITFMVILTIIQMR